MAALAAPNRLCVNPGYRKVPGGVRDLELMVVLKGILLELEAGGTSAI